MVSFRAPLCVHNRCFVAFSLLSFFFKLKSGVLVWWNDKTTLHSCGRPSGISNFSAVFYAYTVFHTWPALFFKQPHASPFIRGVDCRWSFFLRQPRLHCALRTFHWPKLRTLLSGPDGEAHALPAFTSWQLLSKNVWALLTHSTVVTTG